jgi:hypothetical protein
MKESGAIQPTGAKLGSGEMRPTGAIPQTPAAPEPRPSGGGGFAAATASAPRNRPGKRFDGQGLN